MFIINHFYKLTKELPKPNVEIGNYTQFIPYGTYGVYSSNMYITTYDQFGHISNQYYPMPTVKAFTVGKIYQACSTDMLYNNMGYIDNISKDELECFEEVDIGLTLAMRSFLDKVSEKKGFNVQFTFFDQNIVCVKMSLYTRYNTPHAQNMGGIGDINNIIYSAYKRMREEYGKAFKARIQFLCNYSLLFGNRFIYDIETAGRGIGGRF